MKEVWQKRAAVNIIDGHKDYLQDLARIASPTFRPTTQDILLARVKTTQVVMERYRIDGIDFEMYDVGGQRSERRKWIDCFDNVDAVIFVAALSEYDQTLAEAKRTNRMVEALELFRSVCNNRAFANTSIMLFLNKKDIFAEKIQYSDIQAQKPFQDYAGPPREFNSGVLYFIQKFKECLINDDFNDSFIHVTCATDTNNSKYYLSRVVFSQASPGTVICTLRCPPSSAARTFSRLLCCLSFHFMSVFFLCSGICTRLNENYHHDRQLKAVRVPGFGIKRQTIDEQILIANFDLNVSYDASNVERNTTTAGKSLFTVKLLFSARLAHVVFPAGLGLSRPSSVEFNESPCTVCTVLLLYIIHSSQNARSYHTLLSSTCVRIYHSSRLPSSHLPKCESDEYNSGRPLPLLVLPVMFVHFNHAKLHQ
jgi:GTPase SAR1 family protein